MRIAEQTKGLTLLLTIALIHSAGAQVAATGSADTSKSSSGQEVVDGEQLTDDELDALIAGAGIGGKLRRWEKDLTFQGVAGYNDNVLRGPFREDGSVFYGASVEAFFWRLPREGKLDFYTYLLADTIRYPDAEGIDGETLVLTQSKLSKSFSDSFEAGTVFQYTYADQVFDVSTDELDSDTTLLRFHQWVGRVYAERKVARNYLVSLEGAVKYINFLESSDDYTAPSLELSVERAFKGRSKASFRYQVGRKIYTEREQRGKSGDVIEMSALEWTWHEIGFDWRQQWGKNGNIRNDTKIFWKLNRDNGSGYYDFNRYGIKNSLHYQIGKWDLEGEVKISQYDYLVQTVGAGDEAFYARTDTHARARLARLMSDHFKWYVEYSREESFSDRESDAFRQIRWILGIERSF
jgi:hypothetical protein